MRPDKIPPLLADPAPQIPKRLAVRLARPRSPVVFTLVLGVFLTAIGIGAWLLSRRMNSGDIGWPVYLFSGVFAFFGILLLWSWFRQVLLAGFPQTLVEVSTRHLRPGQAASIALIQPGPAHLKSLRANLICAEQHITWKERSGDDSSSGTYRQVDEKQIHSENLIDASEIHAAPGGTWQEVREFMVPPNARPSVSSDNHAIIWRIELWGKAGWHGSFLHTYEIDMMRE